MSHVKSLIMLPCRASVVNGLMIYMVIVGICCISPSLCTSNVIFENQAMNAVEPTSNSTTVNGSHPSSPTLTFNISAESSPHLSNSTSLSDDYDYYSDPEEAKRVRDNSKIAQIVVYFSVILIALVGILLKYFVTQFETSQLKAQEQLNYQRLQNA